LSHQAEKRLLTAKQATAYLGIGLYTLKKIEYVGYLKPYRTPGGHRRYSRQMLDEYLEKSTGFSHKRLASEGKNLDSRPGSEKGG
jgi:excisionase family DNA binding protein